MAPKTQSLRRTADHHLNELVIGARGIQVEISRQNQRRLVDLKDKKISFEVVTADGLCCLLGKLGLLGLLGP